MSSPKHSDQISKENCTDIQQANGRIMDKFPEEGFTPWLVDSYRAKGVAIIVCHEETDQGLVGWWPGSQPLRKIRSGTCCSSAG